MNAADQRRLTPLLGTACLAAAAVLVALVLGVGRSVRWQAAQQAAALPRPDAAALSASPPLSQFADVWRHPLLTPDRQPATEEGSAGADVRLGNLQLTGIILTPDLRMALLHAPPDRDVRVREGENVGDSGWTLVKLGDRSAVFERGGQRTELELKVDGGGAAEESAPAPGPSTPRMVPKAADRPAKGHVQALQKRNESRRRPMQAPSKTEH